MSLEQSILNKGEKSLKPYRIKGEELKKDNPEYQAWVSQIESCLQKATYWHGTGRYHYQYKGESRYESVNVDGLLDVFGSIIEHDGLIPHQDPWIDSGGKTVSLGTVRIHSRLFARIHLYEHEKLIYELGSVRYWVRLYMCLLFFWLFANLDSFRQFGKSLFRRSTYKDLQSWTGAIRKPQNGKVISLWNFVSGESPDSDIKENYPILFGIAKGILEVINTIPLTHAVEVRSLQSVTLKDFTHIEVPLGKVKETEEFLKTKNVSLPVLPMEFVDAYMCDVPLKQLAYSL